MRVSALAALGLAAYSVFLVATIPAAYVAAQIQASAHRAVEITEAQGTLWRGNARVRIAPTRGGRTIERVEWRFLPARLFTAEIAFGLNAAGEGLTASLDAARSPSRWTLSNVRVTGDAAGLAAYAPLLATWRPSGPMEISAPAISLQGREVRGALEAEWRDAVSGLSDVRPLGTYRASWRGDAATGSLAVTTVRGPLRITGAGTTTGMRLTFNGEARGEGAAAQALEPLLALMGPRRPDGSRALELRLD